MRRHGWELPYHPLQVVAIAVFLALAFAFYVFLAPFLGSRLMEIISLSIYSPLMVSVFGLYIWCAASNPADPAVFLPKKNLGSCTSRTSTSIGTSTRMAGEKIETSTEPSSLAQPSSAHSRSSKGQESGDHADKEWNTHSMCGILPKSSCVCGDNLCDSHTRAARLEEDKLYCSLCEVEIYKRSKHCRVCDKCIDCFDHHCRWLNNCIGRKNYKIFIALMIFGVCLLVLEWAIGVWVIARCFLDRNQFQEEISSRLGSSFPLVAFLSVVVVSTLLAAFATLPLGQLCMFHALLIHKGLSTYDYIIAMRERDQHFAVGQSFPSPYTSPASSVATAMSGASSTGALHHASWCTPPRLLVDHEHNPIVDFDHVKNISLDPPKRLNVESKIKNKPPAKISPWALARLNPEDALRAAVEARMHSSVLRPVVHKDPIAVVITETDSSCEQSSDEVTRDVVVASSTLGISGHGKPSNGIVKSKRQQAGARPLHGETSKVPVLLGGDARGFIEKGGPSAEVGTALMPLQLEARNAFCGRGNGEISRSGSSSISTSTVSSAASPEAPVLLRIDLPQQQGVSSLLVSRASHPFMQRRHASDGGIQSRCCHYNEDKEDDPLAVASKPSLIAQFERSTSDGYEASGGESADDSDQQYQAMYSQSGSPMFKSAGLVLRHAGVETVPFFCSHHNQDG